MINDLAYWERERYNKLIDALNSIDDREGQIDELTERLDITRDEFWDQLISSGMKFDEFIESKK